MAKLEAQAARLTQGEVGCENLYSTDYTDQRIFTDVQINLSFWRNTLNE